MSCRPCVLGPATLPTASKYSSVFDSTRGLVEAGSLTAAVPVPGTLRGKYAGMRIHGGVAPVTQGVTVKFYRMVNPSLTTNSAWEVDPDAPDSGSKVVAAGDSYTYNYLPTSADFLVTMLAGGTAPDSVASYAVLEHQRTSGR